MANKGQMLRNNGYDWYVVTYEDGEIQLKHESMLSNILQCGHAQEDYGIANIEQCWGGEGLFDD